MSGGELRGKIKPPPPPTIVVETAADGADFSFLRCVNAHAAIAGFEGEKIVALDLRLEARNLAGELETRRYVIQLDDAIDPYLFAADLQACADSILRRTVIDAGLDSIEAERMVKEAHRLQRVARRQLHDGFEGEPSATCSYCPRSTSFIVAGVRYCKRHAEEYGVRPHGKIGEGSET